MDPIDNVLQVECESDDRIKWNCVVRSMLREISEGSRDFLLADVYETPVRGISNFKIKDSLSTDIFLAGESRSISIDFGDIYRPDGRCSVIGRNTLSCDLV